MPMRGTPPLLSAIHFYPIILNERVVVANHTEMRYKPGSVVRIHHAIAFRDGNRQITDDDDAVTSLCKVGVPTC
jgi:hypothetical protein